MQNKKLWIILLIAIVVIFAIVKINTKEKEDISPEEIQEYERVEKVGGIKENGTYELYNTDIVAKGGTTKLTATVKNISEAELEEQTIEISLLDANENEIGVMKVVVPKLDKGAVTIVSTESLTEYENIDDFKIK